MAMTLCKVVGRQEAQARAMADAGYIEVNPDMAHELRRFEDPQMSPFRVQASEMVRKRELEAGIFTWVRLEDLEKYYVAQKDWVHASRVNNLIVGRKKTAAALQAPEAISAAPGTVVPPADSPLHRSTDVHPEPPLDWKGPAKRFDPFGKDFVVNSRPAPQSDVLPSGPLGKSYQPPSANGKSSWPGAKW